jgi:RNA-directed DNA polymerase
MMRLGLFYVRFMDDILVLAPTRWRLRDAVRTVNYVLGALALAKHPDKTFIGRIKRGFDFLGYHFSPGGLRVAKQTIANFIEKASRLYEQKRRAGSAASPLEMYVRRWFRWTRGGAIDPWPRDTGWAGSDVARRRGRLGPPESPQDPTSALSCRLMSPA